MRHLDKGNSIEAAVCRIKDQRFYLLDVRISVFSERVQIDKTA